MGQASSASRTKLVSTLALCSSYVFCACCKYAGHDCSAVRKGGELLLAHVGIPFHIHAAVYLVDGQDGATHFEGAGKGDRVGAREPVLLVALPPPP